MKDVIVINRDEASKACAEAIHEFFQNVKAPEDDMFHAMKMMELTVFSAMVVSKLFEDQKLKWEKDHE